MDYDTICKIIGQLYLESRKQVSQHEERIRSLILENQELKNKLSGDEQRISDK